jgi:hypothetical protein
MVAEDNLGLNVDENGESTASSRNRSQFDILCNNLKMNIRA